MLVDRWIHLIVPVHLYSHFSTELNSQGIPAQRGSADPLIVS